jgi:site-specific DNA recombinase
VKDRSGKGILRCAIYTRVSTEQGLEQDFNSLDAQREAREAYIKSQAHEGWRLVRDRYDDGGFSGGSMDRPALQKLLIDVQARRIDVIVVYKVDRLTRSLADFAKLVETFDAHGVSFVSVTQSFNTTTSMGRLTLNVLLSFAQFEREVTGERIRDKIAASKKKGMWMGGVVPLGYRVQDRALHIVENHAEIVRYVFRRYLEAGSVVRLKQRLDAEGFRIPIRIDGAGRSTWGGLFSRGHVYRLLSNPIYVGRIAHKAQIYEGHHPPILTADLWDEVQQSLCDHLGAVRTKRTRQSSDALLTGKIYDDGGNRMSPTWARKGSKRWRYYVSQAVLQGDKSKAGSIVRVPTANIETLVTEALSKLSPGRAASQTDICELIDRVVIGRATIRIQLSEVAEGPNCARVLTLPWTRSSPYRTREIIQGVNDAKTYARPMRANARAILIEVLRDGHRWLDELLSDPSLTLESIASREDKTVRSIQMTLSLAFLAPEIVRAAVEGRLPRGFGLKRLVDLPMAWPDQWRALGLSSRSQRSSSLVTGVAISSSGGTHGDRFCRTASTTRKSAQIDVISCAEQSAVGTVGLVGDDSKVRSGVGLARLDGLALEFSAQGRRQRGAGYEGLLQRGDVRACRVRFVEHDLSKSGGPQ